MNPIQEKIATGMNPLVAFLSEATCGEACWEAREDVCRCSCGGKNHGCMRTADGTRPVRTAKIDGYRYELKAVGRGLYEEAEAINKAAGPKSVWKDYTYHWQETDLGAPARVKPATKDQIARWPELKGAREAMEAIKASESWCWKQIIDLQPYLLWVKIQAVPHV